MVLSALPARPALSLGLAAAAAAPADLASLAAAQPLAAPAFPGLTETTMELVVERARPRFSPGAAHLAKVETRGVAEAAKLPAAMAQLALSSVLAAEDPPATAAASSHLEALARPASSYLTSSTLLLPSRPHLPIHLQPRLF